MKKMLLMLATTFVFACAHSQFIYKIKADSVLITNDSCTAELNLENSTKNIKGFLYNKGNGRTEFRKAIKLNDSTLIFGGDTLVIRRSGVTTASNGLTITGNNVQLGQDIGAPGDPAILTSDREIPMNNHFLNLRNESTITKFGLGVLNLIDSSTLAQSYLAPSYLFADMPGASAGIELLGSKFFYLRDTVDKSYLDYKNSVLNIRDEDGFPAINLSNNITGVSTKIHNYGMEIIGDDNSVGAFIALSDKIDLDKVFIIHRYGNFRPATIFVFGDHGDSEGPGEGQMYFFDSKNVAINTADDNGRMLQVNGSTWILDTTFSSKMVLSNLNDGEGTDSVLVKSTSGEVKKVSQASITNRVDRTPVSDEDYFALGTDNLVAYVSLTAARTVTLTSAAEVPGKVFIIKDETGSAATHNITIDGFLSETIEGVATKVINTNYGSLTIYSNGTNWFIIRQ